MHRCLIADHSPIVRRVAKSILMDFGFDVQDVQTGAEAIAIVNRFAPRVILVDSALRDIPVLDVLRHIRDTCRQPTHAVYCPSEFDLLDLQRAHAAGATDVLVKPFDRATLAGKIETWLGEPAPARPAYISRLARSEIVRV